MSAIGWAWFLHLQVIIELLFATIIVAANMSLMYSLSLFISNETYHLYNLLFFVVI